METTERAILAGKNRTRTQYLCTYVYTVISQRAANCKNIEQGSRWTSSYLRAALSPVRTFKYAASEKHRHLTRERPRDPLPRSLLLSARRNSGAPSHSPTLVLLVLWFASAASSRTWNAVYPYNCEIKRRSMPSYTKFSISNTFRIALRSTTAKLSSRDSVKSPDFILALVNACFHDPFVEIRVTRALIRYESNRVLEETFHLSFYGGANKTHA